MSSPFTLTGAGCCTFSVMTSVFLWLIFRLTYWEKVLRRDVFSCMCWWVCETSARSSAKSRSSSVDKRVHLMPRAWFSVVRRITQPITMLKNSADIEQPCLTPVLTSKLDLLFPTWSCRRSSGWIGQSAVGSRMPWGCAKDHLGGRYQRLFQIYKVDVQLSLSFCALLNDVFEGEWSMNPLPLRKPPCSFLDRWSTPSEIRYPVFW